MRTPRLPLVAGVALAAAIGVAGCSAWSDDVDSRQATAGLPSRQQDLEAREWVLDRGASTPAIRPGNAAVTIAFRDGSVHGTGPCNSYFGRVTFDGDEIEITGVGSTQMSCRAAIMRAENRYLAALESVDDTDLDDDGDELSLTGGGVHLRYHAYDADELLLGEWDIVNVAQPDAIVGVMPGTRPTVTFHENGEVTLATGCNDASGSWELRRDEIEIGPLAQTLRECIAPDGVMDQEAALVAALTSAQRAEVGPDTLTLLDDDGHIALVATRTPRGSR